ncbi:MAG: type II toxin-antitoxin system Phd/YefM family antitoxin [Acidobacteria bacterium]|nr:type II toxin-antitoxin system Phd/YefM family antitoxin [Acidobacteriota bacterium]
MARIVGAAEFKATCLRVIKQMGRDGEPVTITNRGRPVAILSPAPASGSAPSIIGAMRGSVLRYDSPFSPAADPSDWTSAR